MFATRLSLSFLAKIFLANGKLQLVCQLITTHKSNLWIKERLWEVDRRLFALKK